MRPDLYSDIWEEQGIGSMKIQQVSQMTYLSPNTSCMS